MELSEDLGLVMPLTRREDEAVPGELPSPPTEELAFKRNSLGNFRPALLTKALGQELGGMSKEDVAKLGDQFVCRGRRDGRNAWGDAREGVGAFGNDT